MLLVCDLSPAELSSEPSPASPAPGTGDGWGTDKFHLSARAVRNVLCRTGCRGAKGRHRDKCPEKGRVNQAIVQSCPRQPCLGWGHHPRVSQPPGITAASVGLGKAFKPGSPNIPSPLPRPPPPRVPKATALGFTGMGTAPQRKLQTDCGVTPNPELCHPINQSCVTPTARAVSPQNQSCVIPNPELCHPQSRAVSPQT